MIGPGKYDDLATMVRNEVKGAGVVLIVVGGQRGSGFSVQAPLSMLLTLPDALRGLADEIEKDVARSGPGGAQ